MIAIQIERLLQFAIQKQLMPVEDLYFVRNSLLDLFKIGEPAASSDVPVEQLDSVLPIMDQLLDYGATVGLIPENTITFRDLLDARIMGMVLQRPSEVAEKFFNIAAAQGIKQATDMFYTHSIDSNYIRMDRIRMNMYWTYDSPHGPLEITVNLSKPEKDPKEIALLKNAQKSNYPACLLCIDNVGYAGRLDHPARQNLRVIPLTLNGSERWHFQYSPYVYYNEHSIVFRNEHVPMRISAETFRRLIDFVDQFPHYFIGSNADLPIVGGSILNHDHFQAGNHEFAMAKAPVSRELHSTANPEVKVGIVEWPMSVVRLRSHNREELLAVASTILNHWRVYSDPSVGVIHQSIGPDGEVVPHHTVTPIARLRDGQEYELDLVLRNNRTNEEHPDGIFHPHKHLHHIKRENIGLIEVMGLAVLPGRLKIELEEIAQLLSGERNYHSLDYANQAHGPWIDQLIAKHGNAMSHSDAKALLEAEVGRKFSEVLECAGVFKRDSDGDKAFAKFLSECC